MERHSRVVNYNPGGVTYTHIQASLLMFLDQSLIDDHYMIKEQATGLDINVVGILVKNLTKYCKT